MPKVDYELLQRSPVKCRTMRAARAWSGMSAVAWAEGLGYSRGQVNNFERDQEAPLEVLRMAGDVIGAPLEWMEHGFPMPEVSQRPAALERTRRMRQTLQEATNAPQPESTPEGERTAPRRRA